MLRRGEDDIQRLHPVPLCSLPLNPGKPRSLSVGSHGACAASESGKRLEFLLVPNMSFLTYMELGTVDLGSAGCTQHSIASQFSRDRETATTTQSQANPPTLSRALALVCLWSSRLRCETVGDVTLPSLSLRPDPFASRKLRSQRVSSEDAVGWR